MSLIINNFLITSYKKIYYLKFIILLDICKFPNILKYHINNLMQLSLLTFHDNIYLFYI